MLAVLSLIRLANISETETAYMFDVGLCNMYLVVVSNRLLSGIFGSVRSQSVVVNIAISDYIHGIPFADPPVQTGGMTSTLLS